MSMIYFYYLFLNMIFLENGGMVLKLTLCWSIVIMCDCSFFKRC